MTAMTTTTLKVRGMTCGSCARHVDEALRALPGVHDVEVRLQGGEVIVCHDPRLAREAALTAAIAEAGYEPEAPAA